jgi:uncharacterized protein YdaL
MTGLLSSFTAYEKLTISASIAKTATPNQYTATIIITNDGTITATVQKILINGEDVTSKFQNVGDVSPGDTVSLTMKSGEYFTATPGRPVKITVVTSRASYETQLMAP